MSWRSIVRACGAANRRDAVVLGVVVALVAAVAATLLSTGGLEIRAIVAWTIVLAALVVPVQIANSRR